jgi:hypothetical protein
MTGQRSSQCGADGYLRVGELRRHLDGLRDDVLVVLSKDAEGNGFSPLAEAELSDYEPETTWSGDVGVGGEVCVVLWPTN